jgi:FixJ family two-component response regulator
MNKSDCKIFLIDDDAEIRDGISLLLKSSGYTVETFSSIDQFLARGNYEGCGCILLDVFLEGKTGIELQEEIEIKFDHLPIIFISGYGNISMSVEVLKKGALNFLEKPIDEQKLFKAIDEAFDKSFQIVSALNEIDKIRSLVNLLTAREYEIFSYVITGTLNKQIAAELGIAEHTVKNHRLNITEKLGVKTIPEMINMAEKLKIKGTTVNTTS